MLKMLEVYIQSKEKAINAHKQKNIQISKFEIVGHLSFLTKVSSVYMVDSAGIRHFGQQVVEDYQVIGFNYQFVLTRTCELIKKSRISQQSYNNLVNMLMCKSQATSFCVVMII